NAVRLYRPRTTFFLTHRFKSTSKKRPGQGRHASPSKYTWIDCEMTGLDTKNDKIIQIAVLITNDKLQILDPGIELVISHPAQVLEGMNEWSAKQHEKSGLLAAVKESTITTEDAQQRVLEYISKRVAPGHGILCGSSVYYDRRFMENDMPNVIAHLSHRMIVDVSTIRELAKRWNSPIMKKIMHRATPADHTAMSDIRASIKQLAGYKRLWLR
ncbi:Oligoribonuclease, partial [Neolecta irregularis DAH-3]